MSCWRVLSLSDHFANVQSPQLLVKPNFEQDTYTIYLTDLSNIWSEELSLTGIVDRASLQESPIEVSKHDTTQLGILLENIKKSLVENNDTRCRITRSNSTHDGLVLHTTTSLPEPLDSLRWQFRLRKRSPVILRNELILPLLVSSHIQHERVNRLIGMIAEKDRAITRLVDQFESSSLDLAVAFPSIGGMKKGGQMLRRDQAAKHVPGLSPFEKSKWKKETAELHDDDVSTLGLFREALEECTPKVPLGLKLEDGQDKWWGDIDSTIGPADGAPRFRSKTAPKPVETKQATPAGSETGTEDEFETHENFKLREISKPAKVAPEPTSSPIARSSTENQGDTTDDDDDDDLDAPPKSWSQSQFRKSRPLPLDAQSPTIESALPPKEETVPKPMARGFRIGGKKKSEMPPIAPQEVHEDPLPRRLGSDPNEASTALKPVKKSFKIGGKAKAMAESGSKQFTSAPSEAGVTDTATPISASPVVKAEDVVMAEVAETPEDKAERKRRELKRKNEDLVKKQAASKKKKRF